MSTWVNILLIWVVVAVLFWCLYWLDIINFVIPEDDDDYKDGESSTGS